MSAHSPLPTGRTLGVASSLLAAALVALLALPLLALALSTSTAALWRGVDDPRFGAALALSLRTSALSLAVIALTGTPLAWWLATTRSRARRVVELVVELPIVLPAAVVGVALLEALGRRSLLGGWLDALGVALPFSSAAVVVAQVVVAAPFFVQAAANAFATVDPEAVLVARSLGASPRAAFLRVALPVAAPGLAVGASLAWARALGEFGATLLFAGNLPGTTQTMPLAIYAALETDVRLAIVFSLVLAGIGVALLLALRLLPWPLGVRGASAARSWLARVREEHGAVGSDDGAGGGGDSGGGAGGEGAGGIGGAR